MTQFNNLVPHVIVVNKNGIIALSHTPLGIVPNSLVDGITMGG